MAASRTGAGRTETGSQRPEMNLHRRLVISTFYCCMRRPPHRCNTSALPPSSPAHQDVRHHDDPADVQVRPGGPQEVHGRRCAATRREEVVNDKEVPLRSIARREEPGCQWRAAARCHKGDGQAGGLFLRSIGATSTVPDDAPFVLLPPLPIIRRLLTCAR